MFPSDELQQFLKSTVSITLASRNAALIPSVARAKGCVIVDDTTLKLKVLLSRSHAGECLDDVRATGMISVTLSVPDTHRTLQLKGSDARIVAVTDSDRTVMHEYVRGFAALVRPLGFSTEFIAAFYASPADEVAIEFTPSDAFQQTPGPSAGARLS